MTQGDERLTRLAHLGALLASGPDARAFLQGQLSADMDELRPDAALLAACSSPQGRVQAVLWLIERPEGVALITTASVLEALEARLRKYVLRSKVRLERDRLAVGACAPGDGDFHPPLSERAHVQKGDVSYVRLPGHRQLLALAAPASTAYSSDASADAIWRADDVAAGLPQIYPQTHEAFVAQMLNLDVLGGISFTKGCYTGQEIIARAHYRGAVKRRMLRFTGPGPAPAPGTRLLAGDQHAGDVVDAVAVDADRCELLAVVALDKAEAALRCDTPEAGDLHRSPLPYESALRDLGASRTA